MTKKLGKLLTSVLLASAPAAAQISEAPDPLFLAEETLKVTISAPMTTLIEKRSKEEYLPALFSFVDEDGANVALDLQIRTRGNFRHNTCNFPPLSLNFKKKQTDNTLFQNQNKMKLVVHCENSAYYQQTLLREYAAYKILAALTNMSFRVRLLSVTYVDSDKERDDQTRYAFLLEHKKRLADRYGFEVLELQKAPVGALQAERLNLTSLFQLMLGNTDFSPVAGAPGRGCCHNYVLFGVEGQPIIPVPYDFDQSGFVNAPYARPNPAFRIRTVRQRLYRGRCINNEHVPASIQRFNERREQIYTILNTQEGLEQRTRKSLIKYVDDFFGLINDPRGVDRKIIGDCI